jgi:xanthine dehydrogenase accessory factor
MKEITEILAAWDECRATGGVAALATVVRVDGSGYRRPGARMLILGDGKTVGTISGGCLERDVILRAGAVVLSGEPALVRYDSVSEEEVGPAASLGCGGTIDILIEAVGQEHGEGPIALLQTLWSRRKRGVIATVIARQNMDVKVGERAAAEEGVEQLIFAPSGSSVFSQPSVRADIRAALAERQSRQFRLISERGKADIFIEVILPPLQLFIFGAGADVVPLASLGTFLGWRVTVVDMRGGPVGTQRSFDAENVIRCAENNLDRLVIPQESVAVVMNHHWNSDLATLRKLLPEPVSYLGILGPRKRTDRLLFRAGSVDRAAHHVRYPIGDRRRNQQRPARGGRRGAVGAAGADSCPRRSGTRGADRDSGGGER